MENGRKVSKGFVLSLVLVSLLIAGLVAGTFLLSENKFEITTPIISLLCLLVILVLSNSFDYFCFGKLVRISRQADIDKNTINRLENEKWELCMKIMNINLQSQSSSTIIYNSFTTEKMNDADKQNEKAEEEINNELQTKTIDRKKIDKEAFRDLILKKHFGTSKQDKISKDIKIVEQFQNVDSISNKPVFFDGILYEDYKEVFIVVLKSVSPLLFHDKLYVQLNKIFSYKVSKKIDAKLLLLIPIESNSENNNRWDSFKNYFMPAISNNLLSVEFVNYSKDEYESCQI